MHSTPLLFCKGAVLCAVKCPMRGASVRAKPSKIAELKKTCAELYAYGWKNATMEYSGSGDEMGDLTVMLSNAEGTKSIDKIEDRLLPAGFKRSSFMENIIAILPHAFEDNEGSDGVVEIDLRTGSIGISHNEYYVESRPSHWSY